MRRSVFIAFSVTILALAGYFDAYAGTRVPTPAETVQRNAIVRLSSGDNHSCQLEYDGTVRCWGSNGSGQLGDGTLGGNTCLCVSCP